MRLAVEEATTIALEVPTNASLHVPGVKHTLPGTLAIVGTADVVGSETAKSGGDRPAIFALEFRCSKRRIRPPERASILTIAIIYAMLPYGCICISSTSTFQSLLYH